MSRFQQDGNALVWRSKHQTLRLEPWGEDAVRVRCTLNPAFSGNDWALIPPATPTPATITLGDEDATLANGKLTVKVDRAGRVRFIRTRPRTGVTQIYRLPAGGVLLEEDDSSLRVRQFRSLGGDKHRAEVRFRAYEDEHLFGMGQHADGFLGRKGCVLDLEQQNAQVNIPFVVSSRNYGFLWNNPALGQVEFARNHTRWTARRCDEIDYWFVAGDTPAEILSRYADATGHAPMLPDFALGFWQCKLRYRTQDEVMRVAREYKERGLPLSVIVIDYFHWPMMGAWDFDPEHWPDPGRMVAELKEMGIELMVSVWPTVNQNAPDFAQMEDRGLLVRTERGLPIEFTMNDGKLPGQSPVHYYDATNPEARTFLWEKLRENYYRRGIRVYWADACEPEWHPHYDHDHLRYHLGNGEVVGNFYPWLHQQGIYEGLKDAGETEIVMLARSGWAGSQRWAAAIWSGDIPSTFESLQRQIRAGLNMAMSGIPWWTTDIGGFWGGNIEAPEFRELIVRWFQYGVFCPLFRLHGVREPTEGDGANQTGAPNEIWSFGEEAYGIIRELLHMRERMKPYIRKLMKEARDTGVPPMRPLYVDFHDDLASLGVEDEFMFGPDVLVAPVAELDCRSRTVYLPVGTRWRDAWAEAVHEGGDWIEAEAPLERIPVYIREGADVPLKGAQPFCSSAIKETENERLA